MRFSDSLARFFLIFFILAVILPIFTTLLFLFGLLLGSFGDLSGAAIFQRIALAVAALWGTDLALLVMVIAAERFIGEQ